MMNVINEVRNLYEAMGRILGFLEKQEEEKFIGIRIGNEVIEFGNAAKGVEMPPQPYFKDGTFRKRYNKLEYRFMHNGKQECVSGIDENECYRNRLAFISGNAKKHSSGCLTFGQWLKEWHNKYDNKIENKLNIKSNEKYINDAIKALGNTPLQKLSGDAIQDYLNTYNAHKNTRDKIYTKLKSAVTKAFTLGKIKYNPFADVDIKKHQSVRHRPLTFEEQNKIYSNINSQYFNLFKFCCCTGLRIAEVLSVRKQDIDYENGLIFVKRLKKRGKEITAPVPFLPELIDFDFTDKLFNLTYNGFRCYLEDFYKKDNINIKGVLIHNFRSTFASLCYAAGIPLKIIQEWLCHETLAMTADTYTHIIKNGTSPIYEYIKRLKEHLKI